jgi:hypothetical protein
MLIRMAVCMLVRTVMLLDMVVYLRGWLLAGGLVSF